MDSTSRRFLAWPVCVALLAGCQVPLARTVPLPSSQVSKAGVPQGQGELAVSIKWPYRAQVIPTSTQQLKFMLSGPSAQTLIVNRPGGAAPVSTASLQVDVGTGYALTVQAYSYPNALATNPSLLVASGQSTSSFNVLANKITPVTIALTADPGVVPSVTAFSPDNGGPGASVTVVGSNFGKTRGVTGTFLFGGIQADAVSVLSDGTASVSVPRGGVSGPVTPFVDGVSGAATGSFTVLSALGIQPASQSVSVSGTCSFSAAATTSAGAPYGTPTVQWYLATNSLGVISPGGQFQSNGATGTTEVRIYSGSLLATASLTVRP